MAVLIGGIAPRTTTFDDTTLNLEGATGVHVLTVGDRTFVYAAGRTDDGISSFELAVDGSLTAVQNIADAGALELNGAANFASVTLGASTYLYVSGSSDDGISAFQVNADGTLNPVQNINDDGLGLLELDGTLGKLSVATVGDKSFLIATGRNDNGISVFEISATGTLNNSDNISDDGALELNSARDTTTAVIGGRTFVFVAGYDDNGVSAFELTSDGKLTSTSNITDDGTLNLQGALGVATATVGGSTYLVASGVLDSGLSVFAVSGDGQLTPVFNLADSAELGLGGAAGLSTFTLDGETFVAVSASTENAVSVFHIAAGGVLTDVTEVFDDGALALGGSFYNAFANVLGKPVLVAAGSTDNGLTSLDVGSGSDALTGTDGADVLLGLAGDDTLNGGAGEDRMIGGRGNDIYVVDSAGDQGIEQAAGGTDTIQASLDYTLGENLENLLLTGTGNLSGTGNDLANILTGNDGANVLSGLAGADTMIGGAGNDTYVVDHVGDIVTELAGEGTDTVQASISYTLGAQVENLTLTGNGNLSGTGNELANILTGNSGANVLGGRGGKDVLSGGNGKDNLDGGAANDVLSGGSKGDVLLGGKGRDILEGNGGADDFVFTKLKDSGLTKGTRDQIIDFDGKDDIDLSALDAIKGQAGNQEFSLDAGGSFSAGEIRVQDTKAGLIVEVNIDRDAKAEMSILLKDFTGTLDANDFLL